MSKPAEKQSKKTLGMYLAYLSSGRYKGAKQAYARIISQLRRYPSPGIGTMGVTIRDGAYVLLYDPKFLEAEELTADHIAMVLTHEFFHLLLNHIPRYSRALRSTLCEIRKQQIRSLANMAMDYAVNSLMVKLNECSVEDFKSMGKYSGIYPTDVGLPEFKSMEFYLKEMMRNPDKYIDMIYRVVLVDCAEGGKPCELPDNAKIEITGDERTKPSPEMSPEDGDSSVSAPGVEPDETPDSGASGTTEQTEDEKKQAALEAYAGQTNKSIHDDITEQVASQTPEDAAQIEQELERSGKTVVAREFNSKKSRGLVSRKLMELIDAYLAIPTTPWEKLLRRFISNTRRYSKKESLRYPKKRLLIDEVDPTSEPCAFPGKWRNPRWTITFAIDTSGSMSTKDIHTALEELRGVQAADDNIVIHVIECDARIGKEYTLDSTGTIDVKVTGRGGTIFDPVFIRAKELDSDLLIYATDGYAPMPAHANRIPEEKVLWLITHDGVYPGSQSYYSSPPTEKYGRYLRVS